MKAITPQFAPASTQALRQRNLPPSTERVLRALMFAEDYRLPFNKFRQAFHVKERAYGTLLQRLLEQSLIVPYSDSSGSKGYALTWHGKRVLDADAFRRRQDWQAMNTNRHGQTTEVAATIRDVSFKLAKIDRAWANPSLRRQFETKHDLRPLGETAHAQEVDVQTGYAGIYRELFALWAAGQ